MPAVTTNIIKFKNEHTIHENLIYCKVKESDYNLSYNPSLTSGSIVHNFATGSDFVPYATCIGLYNDQNELLMVAKFAQPIPISRFTDMTFIIRTDI